MTDGDADGECDELEDAEAEAETDAITLSDGEKDDVTLWVTETEAVLLCDASVDGDGVTERPDVGDDDNVIDNDVDNEAEEDELTIEAVTDALNVTETEDVELCVIVVLDDEFTDIVGVTLSIVAVADALAVAEAGVDALAVTDKLHDGLTVDVGPTEGEGVMEHDAEFDAEGEPSVEALGVELADELAVDEALSVTLFANTSIGATANNNQRILLAAKPRRNRETVQGRARVLRRMQLI